MGQRPDVIGLYLEQIFRLLLQELGSKIKKMRRIILFIFLLVLCSFSVWRTLLYRDVRSRFSRIQAAGFPVSGAELNAWRRPVPDAENGALVLTQAFALVCNFPDRRSNEVIEPKILTRTNIWTSATRALVEAYVQTNGPALAKVHEGLLLSQFRYPVDFSYGWDTPMPHLGKLREMARIVALQTAIDADSGHSDEWTDKVALQLKLARTLDDEPNTVSHLVRSAIIRMAVKATERSLNRDTPSAEMCRSLQDAFTQAGATNLLPLALVGERAMMIPAFRLSRAESQSFPDNDDSDNQRRVPQRYSGKPVPFLWLTGFFERDLDFYLETMEKSISLAALTPPKSLALTNYMETAAKIAQKRVYIMSGLLLPSLSKIVVREASTQALMELATTALALERFRRDRGRLPGNLAELTPQFLAAVPTDPFDGAPLRYRLLERGYVIYSVDADGRDDGGREGPEHKKFTDTASYDITFVVER
jgi:hypothetical protein